MSLKYDPFFAISLYLSMIYPLSALTHFVKPMAARGLKITASVVALCCLCLSMSQAKYTLGPGEQLGGSQTLVSSSEMFELGIFSSRNLSSGNHYLGIWFKNDPQKKAVWVGNRENPILDSSGVLTIRHDGNLVLTDRRLIPIIVNSAVLASSSNTTATLLDSGNLVLKEGENVVWQSFYYPSDTFLPGMRLGWSDMGTEHGSEQFLVSWQSPLVPATGSFALGLYRNNKTQLKVWHRDGFSQEIGFWDGQRFRFLFEISLDDYNFSYVTNPQEVYLAFSGRKNYTSWFVMASTGEIQEYKMVGQEISMVNRSICYDSATVTAIDCYRMTLPSCKEGNKFSEVKGLMPDSGFILETVHLGLSDCEIRCKSNCSCTAFASYHDDGTGCKFYYGDKTALRDNVGKANETIYIRGDSLKKSDRKAKRLWWIAVIPIVAAVLPVITLIFYFRRRKYCCKKLGLKCNEDSMRGNIEQFLSQLDTIAAAAAADTAKNKDKTEGRKKKGHELPLLNFSSIERATNYFSEENKLGEGGFGPVYKALLLGHEVAVKRLSAKSGQGLEEFKNELQSISKLQHRNLVRLLGCCIEGEEKILIYEYLANKSLDIFLFDPEKKALLDWNRRVCIIEGIAQGLLYLHKYSRLRIIHRDLKTGNILLDDQMNPKISDFGMARIFGDNEAQAKTTRVVGTYGYMSPEYAVHGLFSIKSDVFSFGVIILEVISGRKSSTFYHPDFSLNLLVHAWDLWKDGHGLEFVDPALANSFSISEFLMYMQVALLCVQESPRDRPTMSEVVSMLSNESTNLPVPRQPAFSASSSYSSPGMQVACSSGNVTFSDIEAR